MPSPPPPTLLRRFAAGLNRYDAIGIAIGAASLLASCLLSTWRDPYFWYDEVATATLLRDPSGIHMLRAIAHGAENNPPLYLLLMRGWSALFGTGPLSLRIVSALALSAALALAWRTLRRAYPTHAVGMGVAAVFFGAPVLLEQVAQARYYGLFVLAAAVAMSLAVAALERRKVSVALALATCLAHALLVYVHTFGGLFSAALLGAMVVVGLRRGILQPRVYVAIVTAWLLFAFWAPVLISGARMMAGRSWIPLPQRGDLFDLLARQAFWLPIVAVAAALIGVAFRRGAPNTASATVTSDDESARTQEAVVVVGAALIGVAFVAFAASRAVIPVFVERYMLPGVLGWAAIAAHLVAGASGALRATPMPRGARSAFALLYCGLALYPIAFALAVPRAERPAISFETSSEGELRSLPVVVEAGHDFLPLRFYAASDPDQFRFVADTVVAGDMRNAAGAMQELRLMEVYAREGYLGRSMVPIERFLCETNRFLVVDHPDFLLFEQRFRTAAGERERIVGRYESATVRLVEVTTQACRTSEAPGR